MNPVLFLALAFVSIIVIGTFAALIFDVLVFPGEKEGNQHE